MSPCIGVSAHAYCIPESHNITRDVYRCYLSLNSISEKTTSSRLHTYWSQPIWHKITEHFQWKTSLWFNQKGKKQEKLLASWSTPFQIRWNQLLRFVHRPGYPMNLLMPAFCFFCFFPFWLNHSDIFHWKCFVSCLLFMFTQTHRNPN